MKEKGWACGDWSNKKKGEKGRTNQIVTPEVEV